MTFTHLTLAATLSLLFACGGSKKPNVPVTLEAARQTALAQVPGQLQEEELEEDAGRWVYEFDIKPNDPAAPVKEVVVDAHTGHIVLVEDD